MRVLIVDEEPRVAEALGRWFSELEPSWELVPASSAGEALAALSAQPCDVLITELRGEHLDGAALLSRVAERHPRAARFVLSGRHDYDAPFELLHVAHQLLPKPCAAKTLRRVVSRLQELSQRLSQPELQVLAHEAGVLSSPCDPRSSAAAIQRLFRTDAGCAAKLMQLASSGFVGGSSKLADLDAALQQLGAHFADRLAHALCAPRAPSPTSTGSGSRQQRSVNIARLAASLARLPEDAAAAYLAGLLCDVGQLLLEERDPERLRATSTEAIERALPEHVVERAAWGATHAELGAYLMGLWGLPFQVVEAIAHHHAPQRAAGDCVVLTRLVWVAACVVEGEAPSSALLSNLGAEELYESAQRSWPEMRLEQQRRGD